MLFGSNWPEASLNMVMRNIQDVIILSLKIYLLYVLFSYSYKSSITHEIPLSIPMTMHTATYRLFMYQDENEPEGKNSCLALKWGYVKEYSS